MSGRRSRFTLRQIEVLVAVADHASITHAAEWLLVSQPAVTRTIQEIENEVGAPLFDRVPRGMIPTVFGESMIRHAKAVLAELRHAGEEIESLKGNEKGVVRVGTAPLGAPVLLPTVASRLIAKHPGLRVEIFEENFTGLISTLRTGGLDLVVGPAPEDALDPVLQCSTLFTDELVIVASKNHPLAGEKDVPISRIANENWVMPPHNNRPWRRLESRFLLEGVSMPPHAILSSSIAVVRSVLMQGNWLTVYPRLIVHNDLRDGTLAEVALAGEPMEWDVVVYSRSTAARSPAARAMMAELEAFSPGVDLWRRSSLTGSV